jgi:uncharacterized protein
LTNQVALGAPGIYVEPAPAQLALRAGDMHVCAFVGVAPRGPVRVPLVDETWPDTRPTVETDRPRLRSIALPVESWDEYRRLYGGFEGSGLLPYAVASFFQQGGLRAYVVRIVHDYSDPVVNAGAVAAGQLVGVSAGGGDVNLAARNEGAWGNRLSASLAFQVRPLAFDSASTSQVTLPVGAPVSAGVLLRLADASGVRVLRFVSQAWDQPRAGHPGYERIATLGLPASATPVSAEIVEATLVVSDGDPLWTRQEVHIGLGLSPDHPRWLATVMCNESELVYPDPSWIDQEVVPASAALRSAQAALFAGGADRDEDIVPDDFFDPAWVLGNDAPASGVHALVGIDELSLLVVPDLYSPQAMPAIESIVDPSSLAGPDFERCAVIPPAAVQAPPATDLIGLRLDPELPDDLMRIINLQRTLADLAALLRSFVVLLDVPPRLGQRQILAWRSAFDTSFAAAYHPWLLVSEVSDLRDTLIAINPSAVAAGIVARREIQHGVPFGPANELADGVVGVIDNVSPARHDELHPNAINVFLPERDGVRLTAGRTLSRDASYRQLSVRRLMTMLQRVLEREMQWMVFEPNNPSLRASVRHLLTAFLRGLYLAGAFKGATEKEAFFVRCDDFLNPAYVQDLGRLVTEVGVAPVEPMEFLVLRITRDGDSSLRVEAPRG